jgi:hypothetical protein
MTPSASLQTPSDHPPPTRSQQIGGPAELWALLPTTSAPDPPSACLEGWMAPSPAQIGASTPSSSPRLYDQKGGGILPSDPTMVVYLTRQARELDPLLSMAPEPAWESNMAFYLPHCLAASYDARELADLKDTSWEITLAIFEGCNVPDGWANIHLGRHMDFLARWEITLETLHHQLNKEINWQGYAEPYQLLNHPNKTCYVCASEIGWALDCVRDKQGYTASWLLSQLLVPTAAPSHPHINRGGDKG